MDLRAVRRGRLVRISILTAAMLASLTFFIVLRLKGLRTSKANYWSGVYLVVPLLGGLLGSSRLRQMAPRHRLMPAMFRAGLVLWALACVIWMYYNLDIGTRLPYPSWADAAYFTALLSWAGGTIVLYRQIRGNEVIQDLKHLIPIVLFAVTITGLFIRWAHGGELSRFSPADEILKYLLDLSYPIVDAFILALFGTLLAGKKLKKLKDMKRGLWIVFVGYFCVFVSDLAFNIITSLPQSSSLTYYNGGPTDAMFTVAFFIMSVGMFNIPSDKTSW